MRSPRTATKSSPSLWQLEKAHGQQRRPNTAKKKKKSSPDIIGSIALLGGGYTGWSRTSLSERPERSNLLLYQLISSHHSFRKGLSPSSLPPSLSLTWPPTSFSSSTTFLYSFHICTRESVAPPHGFYGLSRRAYPSHPHLCIPSWSMSTFLNHSPFLECQIPSHACSLCPKPP